MDLEREQWIGGLERGLRREMDNFVSWIELNWQELFNDQCIM